MEANISRRKALLRKIADDNKGNANSKTCVKFFTRNNRRITTMSSIGRAGMNQYLYDSKDTSTIEESYKAMQSLEYKERDSLHLTDNAVTATKTFAFPSFPTSSGKTRIQHGRKSASSNFSHCRIKDLIGRPKSLLDSLINKFIFTQEDVGALPVTDLPKQVQTRMHEELERHRFKT